MSHSARRLLTYGQGNAVARRFLRASINDTPRPGTKVTWTSPALRMPPFPTNMPPASPTAVYLKDQRPLLFSLVQALLGHKKPHYPQSKTKKESHYLL